MKEPSRPPPHADLPEWHYRPLWLKQSEIDQPLTVIGNFFDCFHLPEAREILWSWMKEAVSSHRSIATDPKERNSHLCFYEKITAMMEATWLLHAKR